MTKGYLDYQSASPVDARVVEAMIPHMTEHFGNPSILFRSDGDAAREALEDARGHVAEFIGADPSEIVFTSGATEANNMALKGVALKLQSKGKHIISSVVEHRSVITPLKYLERLGFEVTSLPVDAEGFVSPADVEAAIREDTILVSLMMATGEVGTIQPVGKIAEITRAAGALFHTDAVAAEAWIPIDVSTLPLDLMTLSSNDIYGPRGVGALYMRKGIRLEALVHGGGQERGLRSGSENVPGIVGFGVAAKLMGDEMEADVARIKPMRDRLMDGILEDIKDTTLNGPRDRRLPNNASIRLAYIEGESLLLSLDMEGISVSSGSACSAKTLEPSYVQLAMGIKHEETHGSLQFTFGRWSTDEDVDMVLDVLPGIAKRLREMSAFRPGMEYDKSNFGHHDHGEEEE
ncbi:MAG: cysteine desulfurase [Candidatus Eisenbacteria sp.]|nr:cysteine desulfurase [Candidatus Eisenbacteria bacterium]